MRPKLVSRAVTKTNSHLQHPRHALPSNDGIFSFPCHLRHPTTPNLRALVTHKVSVDVAASPVACRRRSGAQTAAVTILRSRDGEVATIETIDRRCFDCRYLDTTRGCAFPMHGSIGKAMGNGCVMLKTKIKDR